MNKDKFEAWWNKAWSENEEVMPFDVWQAGIASMSDAEPVAHISAIYKFTNMPPDISWYTIDNTQFPVGTKLYASPPDQSKRIKELEKIVTNKSSLINTLDNAIAELQKQNDVMREALSDVLEFYLDTSCYTHKQMAETITKLLEECK